MTTPHPASASEISAAYQSAAEREDERVRTGAKVVGHKVGFTNVKTWAQLGATAPMWGAMYDDTVIDVGSTRPFRCPLSAFQGPRIEPEIVVHFSKAPPENADIDTLLGCIDWMAQGFEIVLSPSDGRVPTVAYAISHGGMHGALLLGTPCPVSELGGDVAQRLANVGVELRCDGELTETGNSSVVLGNPLNAVLHLMQGLAAEGRPAIQAGHLVTTGTLTAAYPIKSGQRWSTTLSGLALPDLDVVFE